MSDILKWATLDNSDAIILDGTNTDYCMVGTDNGIKQRLQKAEVTEEIVNFSSWEVDGIINANETEGTYKMIKAGFYGYKTGVLNSVSLYLDDLETANNGSIERVVLGIMEQTKVTIKAWATLTKTDTENNIKTFTIIPEHNGYFEITNELISEPKNGLMILPIIGSFESDASFAIGSTGNDGSYRPKGANLRLKVLSSRSIFDAGSHLYGNDYTLDADNATKYTAEIYSNIITDHIKKNYDNYHLSRSTISGINALKYYAPILKIRNEDQRENIVFSRCYISHDSLSLGGEINLIGKKLEAIQIPVKTGDAWYSNYKNQLGTYISKNNFEIKIAFSETEPAANSSEWISADYTFAPKSADDYDIVWEITFNKTLPIYTAATGVWIMVRNINNDAANRQQIFCRTYRDYRNSTDIMHLHSVANTNETPVSFERTPDIRLIFDFDGRQQFMEMLYRKILALS